MSGYKRLQVAGNGRMWMTDGTPVAGHFPIHLNVEAPTLVGPPWHAPAGTYEMPVRQDGDDGWRPRGWTGWREGRWRRMGYR